MAEHNAPSPSATTATADAETAAAAAPAAASQDAATAHHDRDVEEDGVLIAWEAPSFELLRGDRRWYAVALVVLLAIILFAIFTEAYLVAITFILIGVVGFITIQQDPEQYACAITMDGVVFGKSFFPYTTIENYWIAYGAGHRAILVLRTRSALFPYVHIPIHQVDPTDVEAALSQFVVSQGEEESLIELIERLFHQ